MAIKAGELIHVGNDVLVDRLQSAGPGDINIPTERIFELGNYETLATVRDIPDLQFPMESLDASAKMEAMLLGRDWAADPDGQEYDIGKVLTLDVAGQFKPGRLATDPYDIVASVVVPYLMPESLSYDFGISDNASQSVQFRGDGLFYATGSAYIQTAAGTGAADQEITLENDPIPYEGDPVQGTRYALGVTIKETNRRLFAGTDYTETDDGTGTVTITIHEAVPTDETIRIVYQSNVTATYPQESHPEDSAARPAAIKGRDIEVRIGGNTVSDRWSGVQSFSCEWRAEIDRDQEFGNQQVVSMDFDVPTVEGSVDLRARDTQELLKRIKQQAGMAEDADQIVGPFQSTPLPMDILLHSPEDGSVLKTIHVPDARFTLPGYQGQTEQKMDVSFSFESDGGRLLVYKGERAAST